MGAFDKVKEQFSEEQLKAPVTYEMLFEILSGVVDGLSGEANKKSLERLLTITEENFLTIINEIGYRINSLLCIIKSLNPGYNIEGMYKEAYSLLKKQKEEKNDTV